MFTIMPNNTSYHKNKSNLLVKVSLVGCWNFFAMSCSLQENLSAAGIFMSAAGIKSHYAVGTNDDANTKVSSNRCRRKYKGYFK